MKKLGFLLVGIMFAFAFSASAQLTITRVDPGPYTPGSSIAALFSINSGTCIDHVKNANRFDLYLSDASGNFPGSPTPIGTFNGFYTTFVNGVIPAGTPAGTGYRLRVVSTSPGLTSNDSSPFTIVPGTPVESRITAVTMDSSQPEIFGFCSPTNQTLSFTNASTAGSTTRSTIKNELVTEPNGTLDFTISQTRTFRPGASHYTVFTVTELNGTYATRANIIVNNPTNNSFGTGNGAVKCLPSDPLRYTVDLTPQTGIGSNYPGFLYNINWGDGSNVSYSLCQLIANGGIVEHMYTESSCGKSVILNGQPIRNVFAININVVNPICERNVGSPISTTARIAVAPKNSIDGPTIACTGTTVSFRNTSLPGENPLNDADGCEPNKMTYNWYVTYENGTPTLVAEQKPLSYVLNHPFNAPGRYKITLESFSEGACNGATVTFDICIQDPPKADFTFGAQTTFCVPQPALKVTNTSVVDTRCDPAVTYTWTVTPSVTFANNTNANSREPEFNFLDVGVYTVKLQVTTASCTSEEKVETIIINTTPVADLSPNITLCTKGVYSFNATTNGPTKTILEGTFRDLPTTYTWTVTSTGRYNFVGGTNANSKYPQIEFLDDVAYTIRVVHNNNCSTPAEDTQIITFTPAPAVTAGTYAPICFNTPTIQLKGEFTPTPGVTVTSTTWLRGNGTFSPNRNDPNAVYTPTAAERVAGTVELEFRVTTDLPPPCNTISKFATITIKPEVTVNSAAAKEICTGTGVAYTPTSPNAGATFTWTAISSNATGFSPSGSGDINDILINNSTTTNATVTYTITPSADGCSGTPFTFTVTVKPLPILTVSSDRTICSREGAGITLSANLPNVTYIWTSVVNTGSIVGNTANATPSAATGINDILFNTGTTTATVTYTITPIYDGQCAGEAKTVTITIEPQPTVPNAGAPDEICNTSTYTLKGNRPEVGTGKWTQVTTFPGITFSDDTRFDAIVSGLQPNNTYIFQWAITGASVCTQPAPAQVSIKVNPASVGGTTSGTPTTVCAGGGGTITLTGYVGTILRWESLESGATIWSPIPETSATLTFSNLGVTTQFRAVVQSGNCAEAFSSPTTINVNQGTVQADAGPESIEICNQNSVTLNGNSPGSSTGLWTGPAGVTIVSPNAPTTLVTGLAPGQTYIFKWTIAGLAPCPSTGDQIAVVNLAPIANNTVTTSDATICTNQTVTINANLPTGGNNSYTYVWQYSTDGGNSWNAVPQNGTSQNLEVVVTQETRFRRVVTSGSCSSTSNFVRFQVLPPIGNNTISGPQSICINTAAAEIIGSQPTGGDNSTYGYQWQRSPDNTAGSWVNITGANGQNYLPGILTVSTYFRRIVSTPTCNDEESLPSASVLVRVNPNAKAAFNPGIQVSCAPFNLSQANISAIEYPENKEYRWFVDGVYVGSGVNFPSSYPPITAPNASVKVKLVAVSQFDCNNDETAEVTYSTRSEVIASFSSTVTEGCGATTINFTNTSTVIAGTTVEWLVNGTKEGENQTSFSYTFNPNTSGEDKVYQVVLRILSSPCGGDDSDPKPITIRIKPPMPYLTVDKQDGCSVLAVNFRINSEARTSNRYRINYGDGSPEEEYGYDDVIPPHPYVNTGTGILVRNATITAFNACGETSNPTPVKITISPAQINASLLFKDPSQRIITAGEEVTFLNNTTGAISYLYKFSDGTPDDPRDIPGAHEYSRVFNRPGTVTVTMIATSSCAGQDTDSKDVLVVARPVPNFEVTSAAVCPGTEIQIRNTSTNAGSWRWDFGDDSQPSFAFEPPPHKYAVPGPYTIKLTAYNSLGYPVTKEIPITVNALPGADFQVLPGNVIGVPDYTFRFAELNPPSSSKSYLWDFGDDSEPQRGRDIMHTYADTGTYRVKLIVTSEFGCTSETTQTVRITGVPGYLYLPNSFIPGGTSVPLQTFYATGSGIASWRMQIFNKWGQVLWETTKSADGKPLEAWDGTFKGTPQPQGLYFWKIDVNFINGTEWKGMSYGNSPPKRTGEIYLIR